jgi:hypothetical protein
MRYGQEVGFDANPFIVLIGTNTGLSWKVRYVAEALLGAKV